MSSKTRVANKTIWALEDMMAELRRGQRAWVVALQRAEARFPDPALLLSLAELRDVLASVEALARDARHGRYEDGGDTR